MLDAILTIRGHETFDTLWNACLYYMQTYMNALSLNIPVDNNIDIKNLKVFYIRYILKNPIQENGKIERSLFSWSINFFCRSMQAYFEQWLRLMLRWDPKARGGGLSEGRPQCFKILDTVLGIKVSLSLLCTTHHKFTSNFLPEFNQYIWPGK